MGAPLVAVLAVGVASLLAGAVIRRQHRQLRALRADLREAETARRALADERAQLYDTLEAHQQLVDGWKSAATRWRSVAVGLLRDANPEAGDVAMQAIATSESHALLQRSLVLAAPAGGRRG